MKMIILLTALFTSIFFFMGLLRLLFFSRRQVEKRIKNYLITSEKKKIDKKKFNILLELQLLNQKLRKQLPSVKHNEKLEEALNKAGVTITAEEFILFKWLSTFIFSSLLFLISKNIFFLILGAIFGYIFPKYLLKRKYKKRISSFNDRLSDMITIIVGSLKAGFSFPQALKSVTEESDSPVKEEIELVLKEMQYGSTIEESLNNLYERMTSNDLDLMIQAILIQRQVGGNLATVLDIIVKTIRDRNSVERQVSTLTAQGRLSGIVIGLLPIILGLLIYLISPEYIEVLFTHPIGIGLLIAGILMGTFGLILINKLTKIEV